MNAPAGRQVVEVLAAQGIKFVFWPNGKGWKGPREEDWLQKAISGAYSPASYKDGDALGIMHGIEATPGRYLTDVDIDKGGALAEVAMAILPQTGVVWGRASKKFSHALYFTNDTDGQYQYKDIDDSVLIEFRSDVHQCMAPPSIWQKDGKAEELSFVTFGEVRSIGPSALLKQHVRDAAIGMLLASHLGHNGFGHEARLCVIGTLLRFDDMTEERCENICWAIGRACNNAEQHDIKLVVRTTAMKLEQEDAKVAGAPKLAQRIGENGKRVVDRIREWFGKSGFVVNPNNGKVVANNLDNVEHAFEKLDVKLSYDEFSDKMLLAGAPLTDADVVGLMFAIEREFKFRPPKDFLFDAVLHLAHAKRFHPVKQWFEALRWDGTKRLDGWLTVAAGVVDNEYTRFVGSVLLGAAVMRAYEPGCKYDEMVVFESGQGMNKSTAIRTLCPKVEWFTDDVPLNADSKVVIENTSGKLLVEASDLAGKSRAGIEQLKAMMSRQIDGPVRMAYGRVAIERPRMFIYVGTTNSDKYLRDATGGRRFWPVVVKGFDLAWIAANKDQLWAEALVRYRDFKTPIRMPEKLWGFAGIEQEKRQEEDPWEDAIKMTLIELSKDANQEVRVSMDALWNATGVFDKGRRSKAEGARIADIMRKIGYVRVTVREEEDDGTDGKGVIKRKTLIKNGWKGPLLHAGEVEDGVATRVKADEDAPF